MLKPSKLPLYAKMQKRGQVYIIAAIIIAALIIGLGAVYNLAHAEKPDTKIFDLSREIDFEATQIVDWGVLNNEENIQTKIEALLDYYAKSNPDVELAAVLVKEKDSGGLESLISKYYKLKTSGSAIVQGSGAGSGLGFFAREEKHIQISEPRGDEITLNLDREFEGAEKHTFKLKKGQNFYIILIRDKQSERLVAAPKRL